MANPPLQSDNDDSEESSTETETESETSTEEDTTTDEDDQSVIIDSFLFVWITFSKLFQVEFYLS